MPPFLSASLSEIHLAQPWWLLLLAIIPPLVWLNRRIGSAAAISLPNLNVLVSLGLKPRRTVGAASSILASLTIAALALALARPQTIREVTDRNPSGIDIMLTIDVSDSMSTADMQLDRRLVQRITAAKEVAAAFVELRSEDRIGVTAFAGQPYSISPLTLDHDYLQSALKEIRLGEIADRGTAIGSAIAKATIALIQRDSKSRIIVLLTDGKSQSGKITPLDAAIEASKLDVKIYTIAIGSEQGRVAGRAFLGQQFDIPTLKKIAATTGGEFYRARSTSDLVNTFKTINDLEKSEAETEVRRIPTDHFFWPVLACILLAAATALVQMLNPPPAP